jgi:hypothetical protein
MSFFFPFSPSISLSISFSDQRRIPALPLPLASAKTTTTTAATNLVRAPPPGPRHDRRLQHRPRQQACRREDEDEDDRLVLDAVALEARREDVFLLGIGADGQLVAEAEGAVAGRACEVGASGGGRSGAAEKGGRRRRGFGRVERDDGTVVEADTLAEGGCGGCCVCGGLVSREKWGE